MLIEVDNTRCVVRQHTIEDLCWLDDYLCYTSVNRGARTRVPLLDKITESFPVGLLGPLRQRALRDGKAVTVVDRRDKPAIECADGDTSFLYDWQRAAVEKGVRAGRGIFWITTAGGKGYIVLGLERRLRAHRSLYLSHRENLVEQQAARYEKVLGRRAGRVTAGTWDVRRFTCATFQSLWGHRDSIRVRDLLDSAEVVHVDEVHVSASETYFDLLQRLRNAYYSFGYSGTPLMRGDRRSMLAVGAVGPVIVEVRARFLIDNGYIAEPVCRFVEYDSMDMPGAEYKTLYRNLVSGDATRNALVCDVMRQSWTPALVFVDEISHGRALARMANRAGLGCEFVRGEVAAGLRIKMLDRCVRGDFPYLVTTKVFQEGIDRTGIRSVVNAGAGRSWIKTIQCLGRALRRENPDPSTREQCEFWSIFDLNNKTFRSHARSQVRALQYEGHAVQIGPLALFEAQKRQGRLPGC